MDRAQPSPETEHIGAQGTLPAWVQDHHPLSSILYLVCLVVFTERQKPAYGGLVAKSCLTLVTPWTVAFQSPLSRRFPRQEDWSGLPFPSPGDLPDPGMEPSSPVLHVCLELYLKIPKNVC